MINTCPNQMLNIVVPMAGRGSRFVNAGYTDPKPLIKLGGKPMIEWVVENVRPKCDHRYIFICLSEHLEMYPKVVDTLRKICPNIEIVTVNEVTDGAVCTVLLAREFINNDAPLMIVNSDQFVDIDINLYLAELDRHHADGLIMTFWSNNPKWSYCRIRDTNVVTEVVEKVVVSNDATVGIYNYRHGYEFVRAADAMIKKNLRVNNEFYVAPTYNQLIEEGSKVVVVPVGYEYDGMFGLGVPEDLEFFKTTKQFEERIRDGQQHEFVGLTLIKTLTSAFLKFTVSKNVAGMSAMLTDDVTVRGNLFETSVGKSASLMIINELLNYNIFTEFNLSEMRCSDGASWVEFGNNKSGAPMNGVCLFEWFDRKIVCLKIYGEKN